MSKLVGTLHPRLRFLFSGAWFSASLVSFILYSYLMRPARGGRGEGEA
jgi:hypothetical protein